MKIKIILFLSFLLVIESRAQDLKPSLNHTTTIKIQEGCLEYAKKNNLNVSIAIYDSNGQLISFLRMDGASVATGKIAQWKGLSAANYQFPTSETMKWNIPNAPDIATIPGGLPIATKDGKALGGIGVSGAESSIDVKCAEAGLKAAGLLFVSPEK